MIIFVSFGSILLLAFVLFLFAAAFFVFLFEFVTKYLFIVLLIPIVGAIITYLYALNKGKSTNLTSDIASISLLISQLLFFIWRGNVIINRWFVDEHDFLAPFACIVFIIYIFANFCFTLYTINEAYDNRHFRKNIVKGENGLIIFSAICGWILNTVIFILFT